MSGYPIHDTDDADISSPPSEFDRMLPGMQLVLPKPGKQLAGYLCMVCWRRIPVGQHKHACFFRE